MERRIAEANDQCHALKRECEATVHLLNRLLQTCSTYVNSLDKLDTKDHRINLKYFLVVSQYQHTTHQKILELNVDLEGYLLDDPISDFENFREISRASSRTCTYSENITYVPIAPVIQCESDSIKPYFSFSKLAETNKLAINVLHPDIIQREMKEGKMQIFHEYSNTALIPLETSSVLDESNSTEYFFDLEDGSHQEDVKDIPCFEDAKQGIGNEDKLLDVTPELKSGQDCAFSPETLKTEKLQLEDNQTSASHTYATLISEDKSVENDCLSATYTNITTIRSKPSQLEGNCPPSSCEFLKPEELHTPILNTPETLIFESPQMKKEPPVPFSISESLKTLSTLAVEEKYIKTLPKPHMPDILLKPSDIKHFVIADDECSSDVEIPLYDNKDDPAQEENEVQVDPIPELKDTIKKKGRKVFFDTNVQRNAVYDIECRPTPLIGDICMIGFVESPSNFFIQVSDEDSVLVDVFSAQLAEINGNTSLLCSTKVEAANELGNFCTLAIDGIWYRVEVMDWLQATDTDQVYIQLIDYGTQYSVSYRGLRPLPAFCRGSHRLAQKCYLAYLYPPGSTKKHKLNNWPTACKEAFLNYCGDLDKSIFRITYIHPSQHEKNAYEIDLMRIDDSEECEDKSIGEILLEAELAVQVIDDLTGMVNHNGMCNQILAAHGVGGVTSDMTREEILDIYFDEVDEEPSNINEAVMKYNPRDEAETCRNLRPDGTCYKGSLCKWRHEILRSGFTNDKNAVYWKAFSDISLPAVGEDIFLTVSHVVNIQCFYSQIRNDSGGIASSINDLINAMNEPQMIKKYKKFEQPPSTGELVIAKYWNNYWYRGQIRDIYSECKTAQAEVYFLDFGDILTIPVSDLRNILPGFLQLPFQAIECRLYNLKHKDSVSEEVEKGHFESKLLGVTFKARIVAVPGHLEVLLENSAGQDVGLQMIEEGFGELNTEHYFPGEHELILID